MSLQRIGKIAICAIAGIAVVIVIVILAAQPISSAPKTSTTTPSNGQEVDLKPCAGPGMCHPRFNPY